MCVVVDDVSGMTLKMCVCAVLDDAVSSRFDTVSHEQTFIGSLEL